MSGLLIGTDEAVFFLGEGATATQREEGPSAVRFLASSRSSAFAVTREGALWQRTEPGRWRLANQRPVREEVWSLGADPRMEGRLYLGVSPALLYWSDDAGQTWTPCDAIRHIPGYEKWTFPPPPHIAHVRSVVADPRVAGAVYIGVEEGGVYRSGDNGQTWQSLNEGLYWDVHTVTPDPDGERLYATTGRGFYRSDDGGRNWRYLMEGLDRSYTVPFVVSRRPGRLFTAAAASPPPGWRMGADAALYRSDDGGQHWVRLEKGLPSRLDAMVREIALTDHAVFAAVGRELFVSHDEGQSWGRVPAELPPVQALEPV